MKQRQLKLHYHDDFEISSIIENLLSLLLTDFYSLIFSYYTHHYHSAILLLSQTLKLNIYHFENEFDDKFFNKLSVDLIPKLLLNLSVYEVATGLFILLYLGYQDNKFLLNLDFYSLRSSFLEFPLEKTTTYDY